MRHANSNRIVIIEPQEVFSAYLVQTLESDGLRVVASAPKMEDAELAALKPDVVFIDICLSDASGYTALGKLRKALPHTRLVVFGGSSSPAWRANVWAQNVDAILTENDASTAFIAAAKA
jgi:DNA-binding NarL/FixJ family response regulator